MGKTKLNVGREGEESKKSHEAAPGVRHVETLLVGHDLVVMHR